MNKVVTFGARVWAKLLTVNRTVKWSWRHFALIVVTGMVALAGTVLYAVMKVAEDTPTILTVGDYRPLAVTQIVSTDQNSTKVIAEFFKERRYLAPYDQIPEKLVKAFVSAEDGQFFEHQGINPTAIARAALANFLAGQVVQGGSTITQQIAKSLYLSPDRNIIRKAKETYLAFQLEKHLKKEEILYLYLNQIYLGSGAYGVWAAARQYFQKDLKALTLAEMALIAGLPTAPGKYSPLLNPRRAKERQLYVLKRMRENGYITEEEHRKAQAERPKIFVNDGTERKLAPHLVEHIRRYLSEKYGEKALYEEGLTVVVPTAIRFYQQAAEALESGLEDADQRKGYRGPVISVPKTDWEKKAEELKADLAREFFPFRLLTEDGRLDLQAATNEFDPNYEKSLTGRKVQGIVTSISADQKTAFVNTGMTNVQISFEAMKWARAAPKVAGQPLGKVPTTVNDVLSLGDLVWVKDLKYFKTGWQGVLTQIPELEGALYSVDVQTGQILAMVGGYDFKRSEFNRVIQAKRQVGSTFKPLIYAAAIENGYTPATVIVDSPIIFDDAENGRWKPENYEERFYGDTLFRQALIDSRNIPTIKIVQDIKVSTVIEFAKRLGLDAPFNRDLSISLGSATIPLQDMVHAFTAFPLLGRPFHPVLFEKILDRDGRELEVSQGVHAFSLTQPTPVSTEMSSTNLNVVGEEKPSYAPMLPGYRLDPRVAYVTTHLMKEVVQFGTASKANAVGRPVAGKTGTTQEFRDGWFIGFSPRVVTGVWVGYDDQRPMGSGEVGGSTALPIWVKYMQSAMKDYPMDDFVVPDGIVMVPIDPKSGKRATGRYFIQEAFISGTEPGAAHEWKRKDEIQSETEDGTAAPAGDTLPSEAPNSDEFLKED